MFDLLSSLVKKRNITIDRLFGFLGHKKNYVDGINIIDKYYLKYIVMKSKIRNEQNKEKKIILIQ